MKTALQFSGGKDSMVLLHLFQNLLDKITVYCVRQKEIFPEVQGSIDWAKSFAPHFEEIYSERDERMLPSDVVSAPATPFGRMVSASDEPALIDRYSCCYNTLMDPMDQRMRADGIERVLRGQKNADALKSPLRSGMIVGRIKYYFPIEKWSDEKVMRYIEDNKLPLPASYPQLKGGLDCVGCTAWLEEGRLPYLRDKHPLIFTRTMSDLHRIAAMVQPQVQALKEACNG